jgi:hypothetical protein
MTAIDVHRLALGAVGLEAQAEFALGPRVIAEMHGSRKRDVEPSDGLIAWLDGNMKWIVRSTGAVEAYDLSIDPNELRNLAADRSDVEQAHADARAWWTAHPPQARVGRNTENFDAETRDRMRVLGY